MVAEQGARIATWKAILHEVYSLVPCGVSRMTRWVKIFGGYSNMPARVHALLLQPHGDLTTNARWQGATRVQFHELSGMLQHERLRNENEIYRGYDSI